MPRRKSSAGSSLISGGEGAPFTIEKTIHEASVQWDKLTEKFHKIAGKNPQLSPFPVKL